MSDTESISSYSSNSTGYDSDTTDYSDFTIIPIWQNCKSFNDIRIAMAKFITGNNEVSMHPNHYGPLLDYDPEYIQRLLKLNEIGAISICGQEFIDKIEIDTETDTETRHMQREYIDFAYRLNNTQTLKNIIKKFNSSNMFYYAINNNNTTKLYQTKELGIINFDNPEFWLTKQQNMITKEYTNLTHIAMPEDSSSSYDNFKKIINDFHDNTILFTCWSKTWEREYTNTHIPIYLLDKVIKCLQ